MSIAQLFHSMPQKLLCGGEAKILEGIEDNPE